MKRFIVLVVAALLSCCVTGSQRASEVFEAAPSPIDQRLDTASIEDYILALPPFEFHEESEEQFAERVWNARNSKENTDRVRSSLLVRGDGSSPSKEFVLDRGLRILTIKSMNWEPGTKDDIVTMRRVPGGWMRGH